MTCECGLTMVWFAERKQWACRCGKTITEHEAAAKRLGPFASKNESPERGPEIPGYVQTGPNSYERIAEPDMKVEYAKQARLTADLVKKGGW